MAPAPGAPWNRGPRAVVTHISWLSGRDTLENPAAPNVVKVLGPEELGKRANYSRPQGEAFRGRRAHQVRLEGGDASSDSYCYSS
jgi:hypothetical protein